MTERNVTTALLCILNPDDYSSTHSEFNGLQMQAN